MIEVSLAEFVLRGTFGPFKREMTRAQIIEILGPDDPGYYPDHSGYGNLVFDCVNLNGPPNRIQIGFPHATYMRERPPKWMNTWPDSRLKWELGCFKPGLTMPVLKDLLPELNSIIVEEGTSYPRGRLLSAWVPWTRVDLTFESESDDVEPTLSCISGYANDEPSDATEDAA